MTDNIAILEGYTREVMGEYKGYNFSLLVKPETLEDLAQRFKAWDMDAQQFVYVNGWLAEDLREV